MASLPDDVLVQILLHLPPRSIGRFRAVCRAWRAATTLPSFARAHAAGRPAAVAKVTYSYGWKTLPVHFEFFGGRWRRQGPFAKTVSIERPHISSCWVLGSWDGVLCFQPFTLLRLPPRHFEQGEPPDEIVLWNPITNAAATVSVPAGDGGRVIGGYAHPVTGRFHLLRSTDDVTLRDHHQQDLLAVTAFKILRVGDNNWRQVPWENCGLQQILMKKSDANRHVRLPDGTLHWLVQSATTAKVMILRFDMAREQFQVMEGPKTRPRLALQTTRSVVSDGKLSILTLADALPSLMEMWVLEDYADPQRTWQLKESIRMVWLNGDLSPRFTCATANVELVEGDGNEIFIRLEDQIDAYNIRDKVWRRVNITKGARLMMHSDSILPPEISFGEEMRILRPGKDIFRNTRYYV